LSPQKPSGQSQAGVSRSFKSIAKVRKKFRFLQNQQNKSWVYGAPPMQKSLFTFSSIHGGEHSIGKRKNRRPLSRKKPIHLVLKSKRNLYQHKDLIETQLKRQAEKFEIRLYDKAVARDHVHILAKIPGKREYTAFIRALTGILAKKLGRNLFSLLPFTRVAEWGRDFLNLKKYFLQNREEAAGRRPYRERKSRIKSK
jgi:REP element-mobilizing transposase RayT